MKILIVGPAWIGDMVLAQSLFKLLKHRHPESRIDVLAPAWTAPLLAHMPEVSDAIPLPFKHGELMLGERVRIGRRLRAHGYDWAIVLPRSLKAAVVPLLARVPRRTGFRGEWRYGWLNDVRRLDRARLPRTVDRFVALGLEPNESLPADFPDPQLSVKPTDVDAALARLAIAPPTRPILAICAGAEYGPAKRWPADHFAEVARARLAQGWDVWLFGSDRDASITREIDQLTDRRCLDLAGRTTLGEAIDLMSLAAGVVSNDSGLMHVAAALGRPLVAVYGSSDPSYTPPLGTDAEIVYLGLSCSPCFERECPLGHLRCLYDIAPDRALAALNKVAPV
ncbi:MAG TPA: lipopolysaccharide heptosyltransferase II [Burkholderiales bacterium]